MNEYVSSIANEQQTTASVKEELSTLKTAFTGIQQDLDKVRFVVFQQLEFYM
jgi:hypothetical protein